MKSVLFQIALLLVITGNLVAQDKVQITSTSLKVALPEGFTVDENSSVIVSDAYQIAIIEMAGMNFNEGISDFDNIEERYAEKGVSVKRNEKGTLGSHNALFIVLESDPAIYQIFLGNDEFCTIINVIAAEAGIPVDEAEINKIFSTIEFIPSTTSALEEHANFTISAENSDWEFTTYMANVFNFQNEQEEMAAMILQLPPETLTQGTLKNVADEVMNRVKDNIVNIKIVQEGDWRTENLEGYRMILEASEGDNVGLLYLFVFGNDKAAHVFQGMAANNDQATKDKIETFVKGIKFKE